MSEGVNERGGMLKKRRGAVESGCLFSPTFFRAASSARLLCAESNFD